MDETRSESSAQGSLAGSSRNGMNDECGPSTAAQTVVKSVEELTLLYRPVVPRAAAKVLARLDRHCLRFIELSPFLVIGTSGSGGADVSPRGGPAGFVKAVAHDTLALPDFPGNNRLDSFQNIIENGRIALIFMVPGFAETLRVNGSACVDLDPALRDLTAVGGKRPISVVRVRVEEAYLHCAKAVMRSGLWDPGAQADRSMLPTFGQMLKEQTGDPAAPESDETMLRRYREVLDQSG